MNRNVLTYVLMLLMAVATIASLYSARQTNKAVEAMTAAQSRFEQEQAIRLVGDIIVADRYYKARNALCGERATAMCQLVTDRSYDNLGSHNDIWVGLDAAAVLAKAANLSDEQRQVLMRYTVDVVVALNEYGAWSAAQQGNAFPDRVSAVELYKATVAVAMACQRVPEILDCRKGLPAPVGDALRKLMAFVAEQGPKVDPYGASIRKEGVAAVLAVL